MRRVAALMAAQETQLAKVKCLKFLEQPGAWWLKRPVSAVTQVEQLAQELDLCTQVFEGSMNLEKGSSQKAWPLIPAGFAPEAHTSCSMLPGGSEL